MNQDKLLPLQQSTVDEKEAALLREIAEELNGTKRVVRKRKKAENTSHVPGLLKPNCKPANSKDVDIINSPDELTGNDLQKDFSKDFINSHRGIPKPGGYHRHQCALCGEEIDIQEPYLAIGVELLRFGEDPIRDPSGEVYDIEWHDYADILSHRDLLLFCNKICFMQFNTVLARVTEYFECIRHAKSHGLNVLPQLLVDEVLKSITPKDKDFFVSTSRTLKQVVVEYR